MNIFLTGGSGGIGKEIIKIFTENNENRLYYTYFHNQPKETSNECVKAIKCDLASFPDVCNLIDQLEGVEFDVIINNAFPKLKIQSFYKTEWEPIQHSINVGVRAAFELTKALSRTMKKRREGHIINILSSVILGKAPAQMMPYVIAKYALLGFHNALVSELTKSHIKVTAISPNMVKTGFLSELSEHYIALTKESLPGKKLLDPMQVAEKVKFLVLEDFEDINGVNIRVG